jgi:hypothetical protein
MDHESDSELKSILAAYQARIVDAQEREAKRKADRASFIDVFRTLKAERIGPVLHDFAAQLNEHGHEASVVDQQDASDRNGRFTPASIALRVVPARIGEAPVGQSGRALVEVTFSANQDAMKVVISSSNNGQGTSGKRGQYDIEEVSQDFVVSNVLKTIREAFTLGV